MGITWPAWGDGGAVNARRSSVARRAVSLRTDQVGVGK